MTLSRIPGGDRAVCESCDRRLYVFNDSPWPECKGERRSEHAARPMTPTRPLSKPRPGEDIPAPLDTKESAK